MSDHPTDSPSTRISAFLRRRRAAAVVLTLLAAMLLIATLSLDVVRKIELQSTASSDNVQWTVAQVNVEYLSLKIAVDNAMEGTASLDEVRRRFDVFYSRMTTMKNSPIFRGLHDDPEFFRNYELLWAFLERHVPLVDSDDQTLAAGLPALSAELQSLRQSANVMGVSGIRVFAQRSDAEREGFARTLLQVSILTLGLIAAMGVLLAMLARLNGAIKRQAREIQRQAEHVEAVFATSIDAVIVANEDGRIVGFNQAAERIFGYAGGKAIGQPMDMLIIPPHLRAAHRRGMARYLDSGQKQVIGAGRLRLEAMREGGETFPVELAVSEAEGETGRIFISFLRDMSLQVQAEQDLLRARDEALAGEKAKAELLAVMSHEMRTPLNGMLGTLELLKETRLTPKQERYHRTMETSGRLLLHHVNDVLDVIRLDSGKAAVQMRPADLAVIIADILEGQAPVAKAGGNNLHARLPEDGRTVIDCDPVRLRQLLLNLVGNALKFTRNGEVTIEVERLDAAAQVEFRVTDTGIGIKAEDLDRIFDDFVTLDASYARAASGTGLGLGIVRRWVTAMGGELGVESEPGEGSLFWFRLPLPAPARRPEAAPPPPAPDPDTPGGRRLSVLVVEDNPVNRLVVRELLELDGHRVVEAHDGEEGVQLAASRHWDVILMDVSMPRKDGVAATQEIRAGTGASAATPIIALTAHAMPSETQRFLAAGMQDVMTKPVSRAALRKVLDGLTHNAPATPAPAPTRPDEGALLDRACLRDLEDSLGAARTAVLIRSFIDETDPVIAHWRKAGLKSARDSDKLAEVQASVHRIAGSAAMVGAARLRGQLAAVETACKTGNPERAAEALDSATSLWPETRKALLALHPAP